MAEKYSKMLGNWFDESKSYFQIVFAFRFFVSSIEIIGILHNNNNNESVNAFDTILSLHRSFTDCSECFFSFSFNIKWNQNSL